MKIGILGAGKVGGALGRGWSRTGHEVMFSSRNPDSDRMQELVQSAGGSAQAGTVETAVKFGDVIVIAIPWGGALEDAMSKIDNWSGKIVMDTTNRFNSQRKSSQAIEETLSQIDGEARKVVMDSITNDSPGKDIKAMVGVPTVKAFNTIGFEQMENPVFENTSMLVCGDDEAKTRVTPLVTDLGFEMIDAGPLDNAHLLEAMAELWVYLVYRQKVGRTVAWQLLKK